MVLLHNELQRKSWVDRTMQGDPEIGTQGNFTKECENIEEEILELARSRLAAVLKLSRMTLCNSDNTALDSGVPSSVLAKLDAANAALVKRGHGNTKEIAK